MMTIVMLLVLVGIIFLVSRLLEIVFDPPPRDYGLNTIPGKLRDIAQYIGSLMETRDDDAFLIITVDGTANFVQFKNTDGVVQMVFPMATHNQKNYEGTIRETCRALGLTLTENYGTDGTRFLDYEITGQLPDVTEKIAKVLQKVFGVRKEDVLNFEPYGIDAL